MHTILPGLSVHDFFGRQEEGFFVPIYQRDYTWEEENINRLFEDLLHGIGELAGEEGYHATTFLGQQSSLTWQTGNNL